MDELRQDTDPGSPGVDALFESVYSDLRHQAVWQMNSERGDHTLQATALIHEVYLRLSIADDLTFRSHEHFLAVASNAMRRVLIDHARRRGSDKRGGGVPITFGTTFVIRTDDELIDLDRAMKELSACDPRAGHILNLHVFGGLKTAQIAERFELSERMVRYEIAHARAWVLARMRNPDHESAS